MKKLIISYAPFTCLCGIQPEELIVLESIIVKNKNKYNKTEIKYGGSFTAATQQSTPAHK
jgi:hypothetical protein